MRIISQISHELHYIMEQCGGVSNSIQLSIKFSDGYQCKTARKLLIPARICNFSLVQRGTNGRNSSLQSKLNDTGVRFIVNGLNFASINNAQTNWCLKFRSQQLLLKQIPSCFELKCRAYSLLSQCYHLVGTIHPQKQTLKKKGAGS
jgi:hypothetical protein